jgi:hypothetical protein
MNMNFGLFPDIEDFPLKTDENGKRLRGKAKGRAKKGAQAAAPCRTLMAGWRHRRWYLLNRAANYFSNIHPAMTTIMTFSSSDTKPSGTLEFPPTHAHFRSRFST